MFQTAKYFFKIKLSMSSTNKYGLSIVELLIVVYSVDN